MLLHWKAGGSILRGSFPFLGSLVLNSFRFIILVFPSSNAFLVEEEMKGPFKKISITKKERKEKGVSSRLFSFSH